MSRDQKLKMNKIGELAKKVCPGIELRPRKTQNRPDIFFSFLIYYPHVRLSSILFLVCPSLFQRGLTAWETLKTLFMGFHTPCLNDYCVEPFSRVLIFNFFLTSSEQGPEQIWFQLKSLFVTIFIDTALE